MDLCENFTTDVFVDKDYMLEVSHFQTQEFLKDSSTLPETAFYTIWLLSL